MNNKITAIALIGLIITIFFLFKTSVSSVETKPQQTPLATAAIDEKATKKQVIKATYSFGKGLWPTEFTVKAGMPARFEVFSEIDGVGCMGSIMLPYLSDSVQDFVQFKTNVFEFTPEKPGEYQITCAMGVPHGLIVVK